MLLAVLSVCTAEELEDSSEDEAPGGVQSPREAEADAAAIEQRRAAIRNKILAVGKMRRLFQLLRCVSTLFCSLLVRNEGGLTKLIFLIERKQRQRPSSIRRWRRLGWRRCVQEAGTTSLVCEATRFDAPSGHSTMRMSTPFSHFNCFSLLLTVRTVAAQT